MRLMFLSGNTVQWIDRYEMEFVSDDLAVLSPEDEVRTFLTESAQWGPIRGYEQE